MRNDIYCCGAGFSEGPKTGELKEDSVAPKSYGDGLIGGKGRFGAEKLTEGGFGGGGASYYKNRDHYGGAGGGYTGGGAKILLSIEVQLACEVAEEDHFQSTKRQSSTTSMNITENVQSLISVKKPLQ